MRHKVLSVKLGVSGVGFVSNSLIESRLSLLLCKFVSVRGEGFDLGIVFLDKVDEFVVFEFNGVFESDFARFAYGKSEFELGERKRLNEFVVRMSLLELVEFAAERIRSFRVYFNAESRFVGGSLDRCVYAISEFFWRFYRFSR